MCHIHCARCHARGSLLTQCVALWAPPDPIYIHKLIKFMCGLRRVRKAACGRRSGGEAAAACGR